MRLLLSGLAGGLFGLGLIISGMADPQIVLAFFDVAGDWNPQLAFVMGGAVPVMALAWRQAQTMTAPYAGGRFPGPASTRLDAPLLLGSAAFGLGWGITGLCPAPSIVALGLAGPPFWAFVGGLGLGLLLPSLVERRGPRTA